MPGSPLLRIRIRPDSCPGPNLRQLTRIELVFDTDYDHPMESVLLGHPERVMPFCVARVVVRDGNNTPESQDARAPVFADRKATPLAAPAAVRAFAVAEPVPHGNSQAEMDEQNNEQNPPSVCAPESLPVLATIEENHQSRRVVHFDPPITTDRLVLSLTARGGGAPAALFAVRCSAT